MNAFGKTLVVCNLLIALCVPAFFMAVRARQTNWDGCDHDQVDGPWLVSTPIHRGPKLNGHRGTETRSSISTGVSIGEYITMDASLME